MDKKYCTYYTVSFLFQAARLDPLPSFLYSFQGRGLIILITKGQNRYRIFTGEMFILLVICFGWPYRCGLFFQMQYKQVFIYDIVFFK